MASCRRPSARTAAPEEHNSSIEHGETNTIRATRVRATHGSTAAPLVVRRSRRCPSIMASRPHSRGARLECWQKFWHVGGRAFSARPRQWADRGRLVDLHTGDLRAAAARLGTSDRPHRAAGERPEARASSMYQFGRCECKRFHSGFGKRPTFSWRSCCRQLAQHGRLLRQNIQGPDRQEG